MNPKNISLKQMRLILKAAGCYLYRTSGGHEIWAKNGLTRPIVIQSHKDPIPIHILQNTLRNLNLTIKDVDNLLR